MTTFTVPDWTDHRITCQVVPDTTGKFATFGPTSSDPNVGETITLPVVGWAVVMVLEDGESPRLELEPVVDDDCYGPISAGDYLQEEGMFLELREVL